MRVPLTVEDPADVAFDPITIVLADDHALVRGGPHRILEAEDDFHVVAGAGDATRPCGPRASFAGGSCFSVERPATAGRIAREAHRPR